MDVLQTQASRGLVLKYTAFKATKLEIPPYPTLNKFLDAFRGFDMREEDNEAPPYNLNMTFTSNRRRGRCNNNQWRGNSIYTSRG